MKRLCDDSQVVGGSVCARVPMYKRACWEEEQLIWSFVVESGGTSREVGM
jgi:hypothetical protein